MSELIGLFVYRTAAARLPVLACGCFCAIAFALRLLLLLLLFLPFRLAAIRAVAALAVVRAVLFPDLVLAVPLAVCSDSTILLSYDNSLSAASRWCDRWVLYVVCEETTGRLVASS